MAARDPILPDPVLEPIDSASGCLARIFWMMIGNVVLFYLALGIFTKSPKAISWLDLGYWVAVVAVLAVRYADVRYLRGHTADGAPATLRDWGRYALGLVAVATALWGAAHLLG